MHRGEQKDPLFLTRHVKLEQSVTGFMVHNNGLVIRDGADLDRALVILKRFHKD